MKYIIPKEVTVGTRVYKVKKVRTFGKLCLRGKVRYVLGEILIANYGYAVGKYTPKEQFDTYWHELTHAILFLVVPWFCSHCSSLMSWVKFTTRNLTPTTQRC